VAPSAVTVIYEKHHHDVNEFSTKFQEEEEAGKLILVKAENEETCLEVAMFSRDCPRVDRST